MREVTAAIIRRNGKILICRRAEGSCAHLWEFPGGKTELGETPFECLTRELREELNIEIKPLRELLIDKETRGREIRWKKPKLPVNDREKWRNRAVCERKEMQLNKKSAESGCQSLSALFCC